MAASPREPTREQPAVAPSGEFWDVGDVRLYRSTDENVLLFAPTRLALGRTGGGRYQAALTLFRQLQAGEWLTVAGSALLVLSSAARPGEAGHAGQLGREARPGFNGQSFAGPCFAEQWREALARQGYAGKPHPVFLPLPRRRQRVELLIEREAGGGHLLGGEMEGDAASLVVELTGRGADEWGRALRERARAAGRVRWSYEYPQMLHEAEASFTLESKQFFSHPQFKNGDVSLKVTLRALTWVEAGAELSLAELLEPLDASYLSVVSVDSTVPFPVIVSGRPGRRDDAKPDEYRDED
jgi:hypothetical protein